LALARADVIHGTTVVDQKDTIFLRVAKVEAAPGCLSIGIMELTGRDAEAGCHAIPVAGGDKDLAVIVAGFAALSALLAFEMDTVTIELSSFQKREHSICLLQNKVIK